MRRQARVAVIGGGAMGVSLLYHLTKLGWDDVVLVEKNELTAGSTWHAAGLCTHFAHNLTVMEMRAHSVRLYSRILEEETGQPVGFHQTGALRVTRSPDRMDEFRQVQGLGRFAGYDFNILTPTELQEIYPLCQTEGLIGAIHEPLDGHVDPSQATHAMAAGARAGGAEIQRHNPVEAIERTAGGEWLLRTRNGDIRAEIIVNAAGTWCREIGAMMGLDLPVVPMLHQYLVTDRVAAVAELDRELPIIRDPEESWYVRQERDGLIVGPYEKAGKPWSVDGVPPAFGMDLLPPDLDAIEDIVAAAMTRVPALAEAGIKTVVNGPITFTPDAGPLIGPAFGLEHAWLLTGSSMGVMEGGGAGRFLAEWIVGGEPPMDALVLDPRRFGGFADRDYRIAKAKEFFANQFAIHFPFEERPGGRPQMTSPIHTELAGRGARFGAAYGWERPNWFALPTEADEAPSFRAPAWTAALARECETVGTRVGLADMSVFAKFRLRGPAAEGFVENLGANRPPRRDGGVALLHVLTASGGVASEFTVTRLNAEDYYLASAAAARRHDHDLLRQRAAGQVGLSIEDITQARGVLALAGPMSRRLLAGVTDADLDNASFPWLSARRIEIAGRAVLALRISYVGELGWELHHHLADQPAIFQALMAVGSDLGLGFFGAYAMNALRLEKGYPAWGSDLSTERSPLEAGLAPFVKTANRDFVGRAAMLARETAGEAWRLRLLQVKGEGPAAFYGHPLFVGDSPAGLVTSGAQAPRTGKTLVLAYLKPAFVAAETFRLRVLDADLTARPLTRPPYDPDNDRQKADAE